MDIDALKKRHAEMKSQRQPHETEWRNNARLFAPEQERMFSGDKSTSNKMENLYDATPVYALDSFVSGLFGQMANPANRWFTLATRNPRLQNSYAVNAWLHEVSSIIGTSFSSAMSNFYLQAPMWFASLGLYGIGAVYSEEVVGEGRFLDLAIPLGELFIDKSPDNEITAVHREMVMKASKAKVKFPEIAGNPIHDDAEISIIHCVMKNREYRQNRAGLAGMAWGSYYFSPQINDWKRVGGYNENPYAIVRWKDAPGQAYPTGPAHSAKPDAAMLQAMEKNHILAAEYAARPPLLAEDGADILPTDIVPGNVLYGGVTAGGRQALIPLNRSQNMQLSIEQSRDRREMIRSAFFFTILSLINRPAMTATEVKAFDAERLRQMSQYIERIQAEGLAPLVIRRFNLLMRAGAFPPPPRELEGEALEPQFISPLAKLQEIDEAQATLGYVTQLGEVARATGDTSILDNIDTDAVAHTLHRTSGAPPIVRRDPQMVEQMRKARAEAQAQAVQIEQEKTQVETAAVAAHAEQASSTAQKRVAA